ncbi:MAG: hypothetical protein FWG44_03380 [Oscillospiraceae bacterium]|nr:hypothetical protein [Oscillospiraceae bacterium]
MIDNPHIREHPNPSPTPSSGSAPPVTVGISSLFAVLIILCLTVFAVLARLSAQDERALAEKAADSITVYYEAELRAVEQVAKIQSELQFYVVGEVIAFKEEIDANRELSVVLKVQENGISCEKWAAVNKSDEDESEGFGFDEPETGSMPILIFGED